MGEHQVRVQLDKIVLVVVRRGKAGLHEQWLMTFKGKPISDFRQSRGQLKGPIDSPTRRDNLLFMGDDEEVRFVADEDDEVTTTEKPQICAAASEY
jgi:hypothetical protein